MPKVTCDALATAWNFASRLLFLFIVALLLGMLKRALLHERKLSRTDSLTGLSNRRAFRELAQAELSRASRYGHPITIACLDIDGFKAVNDTQGHAAGDALCVRRLLCAGAICEPWTLPLAWAAMSSSCCCPRRRRQVRVQP